MSDKMTMFWRLIFLVNKLVAGNTLGYFNNNQKKSLVAKDNVKFFQIRVLI